MGDFGFEEQNLFELQLFKSQIINQFKQPPKGIAFGIDYTTHHFGRAGELVLFRTMLEDELTEDESQKVFEYINNALSVTNWDSTSKAALRKEGYIEDRYSPHP